MSGAFPIYAIAGVLLLVGGLFLLLFAFEKTNTWFSQLPRRRKAFGMASPAIVSVALIAGLLLLFGGPSQPTRKSPGARHVETIAKDGWAEAFLARATTGGGSRETAMRQPTASNDAGGEPGGGDGGSGDDPLENVSGGGPGPGAGSPGTGGGGRRSDGGEVDESPSGRPARSTAPPAPAPDTATAGPTVAEVAPRDGAENVPRDAEVRATFSEPMRASTLNEDTVKLVRKTGTSSDVTGEVTYDRERRRAVFDPDDDLRPGGYIATVTTGAKDTAGNPLRSKKEWAFTVG